MAHRIVQALNSSELLLERLSFPPLHFQFPANAFHGVERATQFQRLIVHARFTFCLSWFDGVLFHLETALLIRKHPMEARGSMNAETLLSVRNIRPIRRNLLPN